MVTITHRVTDDFYVEEVEPEEDDRFEFIDVMSGLDHDMWITFDLMGSEKSPSGALVHQRLTRADVDDMVDNPSHIQLFLFNGVSYGLADRKTTAQRESVHLNRIKWYGIHPGHVLAPVR